MITYSDIVKAHNEYGVHIHQNLYEYRDWINTVIELNPKYYLEIGTYLFGSAQLILEFVPSIELLVTVDAVDRRKENPNIPFHKYNSRLIYINGNSFNHDTWNLIRSYFKFGIDACFIDGDHSLYGCSNDYVRTSELLRYGGIIGFHDINLLPGNEGSSAFFKALEEFDVDNTKRISYTHAEDGTPLQWDSYGIGVYKKTEGKTQYKPTLNAAREIPLC